MGEICLGKMMEHKHCNCMECRDKFWEARRKELIVGIVSPEEIREIEECLNRERSMVDPEWALKQIER